MTEVNSQGGSSSTLDYLDMTSAGLEGDRKREHEVDTDEIEPKKQKLSVDDDWMDDGDLFTKVVKSNSQRSVASSPSVLDTEPLSGTGNSEQSTIQLNGKTDAADNVKALGEKATEVCDGNQESKQTVTKTDSIHEDAQTIADLLELKNVEAIRSRLRKVRKNPDRIEIVTNQLLEESEEDTCEIIDVKESEKDGCEIVGVVRPSDKPSSSKNDKKENSDRDSVMQKMLKDIQKVCTRLKQSNPAAKFDTNTAYLLLESNLNKKNRVDIVVKEMLGTDSMESSAPVENRQTQSFSLKEKIDDDSLEIIEDAVEEECSSKDTTVPKDGTSEDVSDAGIDILEEVQIVMKKYPKADANRVYALLECRENHKDRLKTVINILKDRESDTDEKSDKNSKPEVKRVLSESAVADDPLYKDMLQIAKIFPNIDKNEIYALCEVHHDKSRRIELVTEELLKAKRGSDDNDESQSVSHQLSEATPNKCSPKLKSPNTDEMTRNKNVAEGSGTSDHYVSPLDELTDNVEHMKAIFPDCDPDYLYYMLEQRFADPNRVQNLSAEMFELRNYPRLKERLEKEKKAANIRRIKKMEFKMEEFLQLFPNALTDFYDETKTVTDSYKEHALIHLKNEFPEMHATYVQQVFTAHQSHLTPALKQLQLEAAELTLPDTQTGRRRRRPRGRQQKFRKTPRPTDMTMPDVPDEYFYKELMFTKHEQEIKDHVKEQEDEKKRRLEEAREAGELYECTCCYDDEVLFEDMSACPDGHLFCNECVRRSAESAIGEGKVKFLCFEEKCELEFPKNALQKVLSSKLFSTLLRKIQEEEIRQADIPDLVSCPYCSFATIIPEDDPNKVFRCMNPECLKESCRLCKEPNHIPLRCNEVEKQGETVMRTFIENKITEAMIRTCWKCKKRFFKTEGCNMMTCPCGAQMCYVCQKPNIDYSHFGPKSCPGDTDVRKLHLQEMEKAGKLARRKYEDDHPEMQGQNLKYDPFNVLKKAKNAKKRGDWVAGAGAGAGGDYYEDEGDYDDDDESSEGSFGEGYDSSDDNGGAAAGWRFW